MTDDGSIASPEPPRTGEAGQPAAPATSGAAIKIKTGAAAEILDMNPRTVERWVDAKKLRGGRMTDPIKGKPVKGSHRWVDARHVVELAVGSGMTERVPPELRHLIPPPQ